MKVIFRDFNAKVCREDTFQFTMVRSSVYEDSKENGVKMIEFAVTEGLLRCGPLFT